MNKNCPSDSTIAVFEAPIDAMAHYTIRKMEQSSCDGYRLSLGGTRSKALISFLERNIGCTEVQGEHGRQNGRDGQDRRNKPYQTNTKITNIQLCLDNDEAGKEATFRIIDELTNDERFSHIRITVTPPPLARIMVMHCWRFASKNVKINLIINITNNKEISRKTNNPIKK